MAVSWTPFANGVSLLTLRNSINTFNSAVQTNIGAIETDITDLENSKLAILDSGVVSATLATPVAKSLTTAYAKVKMVDTVGVNVANGHITVNTTTDTITVNTTGIYKISYSGSMTAPNNALVTFNYNVNGSSAIAVPAEFVGRGTSPVSLDNHTLFSLTAGAIIYIEAKADSSISMTPQSGNLIIEKTIY